MREEAIIIFVKIPESGKVKTRLAITVGDEKALEIYLQLLDHTRRFTENLSQDKWVFYHHQVIINDFWDNDIYYKQVQSGEDLGQKMCNAFKCCFDRGYEKVCIIGSDLMEMSELIIKRAFACLHDRDMVIGPASDGGYYLLGMKKLYAFLFENKNWSAEGVFQDTVSDIDRHALSYCELETRNDIDTADDWNDYLNNR